MYAEIIVQKLLKYKHSKAKNVYASLVEILSLLKCHTTLQKRFIAAIIPMFQEMLLNTPPVRIERHPYCQTFQANSTIDIYSMVKEHNNFIGYGQIKQLKYY